MPSHASPSPRPARTAFTPRPGRLSGVDAARGLALVGMVATHTLPTMNILSQEATWVGSVFSGRSSILFAFLAGVGLSLLSGARRPHGGRRLHGDRAGVAVRALIIMVLGFSLGALHVNAAVILVNYALLFVLALPFLGWGARPLALLAAGAAVAGPVLSFLVRGSLGGVSEPAFHAGPEWISFQEPGKLFQDLFLAGYYPAMTWSAVVFAGMAVGRLDLSAARVQRLLLAGGSALAVLGWAVSWIFLASGARERLERSHGGDDLPVIPQQFYGSTPLDADWLLVYVPHSGSITDLAHSVGVAMAVLGACLLLCSRSPRALLPLSALGSMSLSLYTLHILNLLWITGPEFQETFARIVTDPSVVQGGAPALAQAVGEADMAAGWPLFGAHLGILLAVALAFRFARTRGPLEILTSWSSRKVRELVAPPEPDGTAATP